MSPSYDRSRYHYQTILPKLYRDLANVYPLELAHSLSQVLNTMRDYLFALESTEVPYQASELFDTVSGLIYYINRDLGGTIGDPDDLEYCTKRVGGFKRMLKDLEDGKEIIVKR